MQKVLFSGLLFLFSFALPAQTYTMGNASITTCGGTFYDSGGNTGYYTAGENTVITFCPTVAGQFMSINFTFMEIIVNYDNLYVYDGNTTAAPLIAVINGYSNPAPITASSANASGCLTFQFISTSNWGRGWAGTLSCVGTGVTPNYAIQNSSITACQGNFFDPGGVSVGYLNNCNATTTICPSVGGQAVTVNFTSFNVHTSDQLYVFDGNSTSSPLLAIFTGNIAPGLVSATVNNPGGCLTFRFISNADFQMGNGWAATISCGAFSSPVYPYTSGTFNTCSGMFYDDGLAAANYTTVPGYRSMVFCPDVPGQCVKVNFSQIALDVTDMLQVYDGTTTSAPLIGMYTIGALPPTFEASTANASGCLLFRFYTCCNYINSAGWAAAISCGPCTHAPEYAVGGSSLSSVSTCNATLTDWGGINGLFDAASGNGVMTVCSSNPSQPFVTLTFSNFDLAVGDQLSVYNGPTVGAPLIGTYTGATLPPALISTHPSGCLTLRVSSDAVQAYVNSGFAASVSCSNPLPVELLSFTAREKDGTVVLDWRTASEQNNAYFELQRSDGRHPFEVIGTVPGAGNSTEVLTYSFIDYHPFQGTGYYRLKQVDYNGTSDLSQIVPITIGFTNSGIEVWPNPAAGSLNLELQSETEDLVTQRIFDASGALIRSEEYAIVSGTNSRETNLVSLAPGSYFIEIEFHSTGRVERAPLMHY